jgi:hypothetical protein
MNMLVSVNEIEHAKNLPSFWKMTKAEVARQKRNQPHAWSIRNTRDHFHGYIVEVDERLAHDYQWCDGSIHSPKDIDEVFAMVNGR